MAYSDFASTSIAECQTVNAEYGMCKGLQRVIALLIQCITPNAVK